MSGTTTTTQTSTLTPAATATANQMFSLAQNIANQPYVPYTGERIAGFTPDQLAAFQSTQQVAQQGGDIYNQMRQATNQSLLPGNIPIAQSLAGDMTGVAQGSLGMLGAGEQAAAQGGALAGMGASMLGASLPGMLNLAQQFPDVNIGAYMNPYLQAALDPAMEDIARRADIQRNQLRSQQAMTGSFGGSRGAIAEMEQERNVMGEMGRLSADARFRAFNDAAGQWRQDQTMIPQIYNQAFNQIGAAQGLQRGAADIANTALAGRGLTQQQLAAAQGGLGRVGELESQRLGQLAGLQSSNLTRLQSQVNPLLATGGLQQALTQSQYDQAYRDFIENRDWSLRGLEALRGALGQGGTLGSTSTTTAQQPKPNATAQTVGAITAGIGALPGLISAGSSLYNLGSSAYNWLTTPDYSGIKDLINPTWASSASAVGPFYPG